MRFCSRLASLSSNTNSLSDSRTVRTSSQARLRTLAPFQMSNARMEATTTLSAAINKRRHLIGSTRRTLCVSWSRLRRDRAGRAADPCSLARSSRQSLNVTDPLDQLAQARIGDGLRIDRIHCLLEGRAVEIGDDRVSRCPRLLARSLLQPSP